MAYPISAPHPPLNIQPPRRRQAYVTIIRAFGDVELGSDIWMDADEWEINAGGGHCLGKTVDTERLVRCQRFDAADEAELT